MLLQVMEFDVHNFKSHTSESYRVELTEENYEAVLRHRNTRNIRFSKIFDFQYNSEIKEPKFIRFSEAVAESLENNADVLELDDVDEMVGIY